LLSRRDEAVRGDCFAERYVEGREFNLSLLDGQDCVTVLPAAEIDFSRFPEGKPRIVGFDAKWQEDSFAYQNTPRRFAFAERDRPLLANLKKLAIECWKLFYLRGYARVDFRVDAGGQPWVLEVNTNPCLSPDAGFAAALAQAGISYDTGIERILATAGKSEPQF
jgi:D-alanine-D-alanine ligase